VALLQCPSSPELSSAIVSVIGGVRKYLGVSLLCEYLIGAGGQMGVDIIVAFPSVLLSGGRVPRMAMRFDCARVLILPDDVRGHGCGASSFVRKMP
jgi:hypothetical protein